MKLKWIGKVALLTSLVVSLTGCASNKQPDPKTQFLTNFAILVANGAVDFNLMVTDATAVSEDGGDTPNQEVLDQLKAVNASGSLYRDTDKKLTYLTGTVGDSKKKMAAELFADEKAGTFDISTPLVELAVGEYAMEQGVSLSEGTFSQITKKYVHFGRANDKGEGIYGVPALQKVLTSKEVAGFFQELAKNRFSVKNGKLVSQVKHSDLTALIKELTSSKEMTLRNGGEMIETFLKNFEGVHFTSIWSRDGKSLVTEVPFTFSSEAEGIKYDITLALTLTPAKKNQPIQLPQASEAISKEDFIKALPSNEDVSDDVAADAVKGGLSDADFAELLAGVKAEKSDYDQKQKDDLIKYFADTLTEEQMAELKKALK